MKLTVKEKGLIALFKKLENARSRDDLLFFAETAVRAQEAFKAYLGLAEYERTQAGGKYEAGACGSASAQN